MQLVGTEFGRNMIHPDIWAISLIERNKNNNVIVSDVRFQNEANIIKDNGGFLIRIKRSISSTSNHISEIENYLIKEDEVIDNNSTIEELKEKVKIIINKFTQP